MAPCFGQTRPDAEVSGYHTGGQDFHTEVFDQAESALVTSCYIQKMWELLMFKDWRMSNVEFV